MIEWKIPERATKLSDPVDLSGDGTHAGTIWRDVEMIQAQRAMVEAQRKTAEQLHKIAVTLDVVLDLAIDRLTESNRTQVLPPSLANLVKLREEETKP